MVPPLFYISLIDNFRFIRIFATKTTGMLQRINLLVICCLFTLPLMAEEIDIHKIYEIGLPVVEIETLKGEWPTYEGVLPPQGASGYGIKNATKVPGRLRILKGKEVLYDSGEYLEDESGMTIRIRGNTTAWNKKKPYKIKLQKKADLLLRGDDDKYSDKEWLLILDESLSAKTGFRLNELSGMQWTPAYEYANVIFNGRYMGVYMLCESVKRNKTCRLDVDKTGFIFEFDAYWWNEKVYVESTLNRHPMHYTFKYPDTDDITEEQIAYFTEMIHNMESSIKDGTYPEYIDVDSFVTWILLHDILGNKDAGGSNFFLTKYDNTDQTKVVFALLWDFDMIFICKDEWSTTHGYGWFLYDALFRDNDFVQAFISKWKEISPTIFDQLFDFLRSYASSEEATALDESIILDNLLWNQNRVSVSERTDGIISWLTYRKRWIDNAIVKMSGTNSLETGTLIPDNENTYYNLQGQSVHSLNRGIYLHNRKKVIVK